MENSAILVLAHYTSLVSLNFKKENAIILFRTYNSVKQIKAWKNKKFPKTEWLIMPYPVFSCSVTKNGGLQIFPNDTWCFQHALHKDVNSANGEWRSIRISKAADYAGIWKAPKVRMTNLVSERNIWPNKII